MVTTKYPHNQHQTKNSSTFIDYIVVFNPNSISHTGTYTKNEILKPVIYDTVLTAAIIIPSISVLYVQVPNNY